MFKRPAAAVLKKPAAKRTKAPVDDHENKAANPDKTETAAAREGKTDAAASETTATTAEQPTLPAVAVFVFCVFAVLILSRDHLCCRRHRHIVRVAVWSVDLHR